MPKTWKPSEDSKFARELKLNTPYYVIISLATNGAPFEDAVRYREFVFTSRAPFTNTPMTDGGETAKNLCRNWGPVFDTKPAYMRRTGAPGPQVGAPLGSNDYEGYLDADEIRGLEKQVAQGSDPRKRRPLGSWRV